MKRIYCILILLLLAGLTGCGQESGPAESSRDDFQKAASIHIYMEGMPDEEYAAASVKMGRKDTIPAEVKLRGNSSKESAKKAYTVKFEDELELFGMDPGRKWALVSTPFDKSLLRPAVGLSYAAAIGIEYTPDFRLCRVWVNDAYMGVYTAMEPVEAGEGRVEIDVRETGGAGEVSGSGAGDFLLERNLSRFEEDKVYIYSPAGLRFEFNEPEEPDAAQAAQCYDLLAAAEDAIFSCDHEVYEDYIDVESFVDFYIFNEMIKDVDFGEYSTRYYFQGGVLHAGPPWDLDLTMGNVATDKEEFKYCSYNNTDGAGDESGDSSRGLWAAAGDYYYWLCRDPWFRMKVQQRWQAVRAVTENLAVDNELGEDLIDCYLGAYIDELESNFTEGSKTSACWSIKEPAHMSEWQEPADTYLENVEMLRVWLIKRAAYLDTVFGTDPYATPHEMSDWSAGWL